MFDIKLMCFLCGRGVASIDIVIPLICGITKCVEPTALFE